jgi:ABC-type oligopeptide transport system substrate-binding subunit
MAAMADVPLQEQRSLGFQSSGVPLLGGPNAQAQHGYLYINSNASRPKGKISIAYPYLIESAMPYGSSRSLTPVINDLYYETLLTADVAGVTDRLYPLVARAVRYPADFSYVVFELDPRVRFQNGTSLTAQDVLFSLEEMKRDRAGAKTFWERTIASISATDYELRVNLKVTGQAARNAILYLSQTKIIRPLEVHPVDSRQLGISYLATGPYAISQLMPTRLLLTKSASYWGAGLANRKDLFHFAEVEVLAASTANYARKLFTSGLANFYLDSVGQEDTATPANSAAASRSESNRTSGRMLHTFTFNLRRPFLNDVRVREALVLAYDFDRINNDGFANSLKRPNSPLFESSFAPNGSAPAVSGSLMNACGPALPQRALSTFETYGNSEYASMLEQRQRLISAQTLLLQAGYLLQNGKINKMTGFGARPVQLNILVREDFEMIIAAQYKRDLEGLGLNVSVTRAMDDDTFRRDLASNGFDIIAMGEKMLDADGLPHVPAYSTEPPARPPCLAKLMADMSQTDSGTAEYTAYADAIARVEQAFFTNIFIGERKNNRIYFDRRIRVPSGMSMAKAYMYGAWVEPDDTGKITSEGF